MNPPWFNGAPITTRPERVFRIFVDPVTFGSMELIATCDKYPTLEARALDADKAVSDLLRLISDALDSGLIP